MTNTAPARARLRLPGPLPTARFTAKTETIILKTLSLKAPRSCVQRKASKPPSFSSARYPDWLFMAFLNARGQPAGSAMFSATYSGHPEGEVHLLNSYVHFL